MGYPIKHLPFCPNKDSNQILSATAVSKSAEIDKISRTVRIVNQGSNISYIRIGNGTQTATTADTPVLPGESLIIEKGEFDNIGYISADVTVLNVQTGNGSAGGIEPQSTNPLMFNPVLWLDASDSSTVDDTNVSTWSDKSAYGNHATQGTGANKPTYNGTNEITFNGSTGFLECTDSASLSPTNELTLYIVGTVDDTSTTRTIISKDVNNAYTWRITNTDLQSVIIADASGTDYKNSDSAVSLGSRTSLSYVFIPGDKHYYYEQNSSLGTDATTRTGIKDTSGNIYIGSVNGTPSELFSGKINEILVFDIALSAAQRQTIETYLASKWGL